MALARSFVKLALLAAGAVLALAGLAPARAQSNPAGWSICNHTSFVVEAATGRPEGRSVAVQGWLRLRPGECRTAASAPLARGVHYLYARTSLAHRGGRRSWGGAAKLCVDPANSFAVENPSRCEPMSLEERSFREVRINKRDGWRTTLAEAEPYSLARARSAGVQRLLSDAGYDSGGRDPRRLATAMARFRADARLAANASDAQLIDALETSARRRSEQVGLKLCNRTQAPVWAAVARRRGEGWESRGWWRLGPSGCARTIDDALFQNLYFVHATMEAKEGERHLAAGGETFCVAKTRFAVIGRGRCKERLYDEAIFTAISPKNAEGMVVDFSDKDFLPAGQKPRRVEMPQLGRDDAPVAATAAAAPARGVAPMDAGGPTPSRQMTPTARPQLKDGQQRPLREMIPGLDKGGPAAPAAAAPAQPKAAQPKAAQPKSAQPKPADPKPTPPITPSAPQP